MNEIDYSSSLVTTKSISFLSNYCRNIHDDGKGERFEIQE